MKKTNPAFAPVTDDPALPRVLLIGDSISIGYTLGARNLLAGNANVHRPAANCASTLEGLANIDAWLDRVHEFSFNAAEQRCRVSTTG